MISPGRDENNKYLKPPTRQATKSKLFFLYFFFGVFVGFPKRRTPTLHKFQLGKLEAMRL